MLPTKTAHARTALQERSGGLSALERRALILSDGNRSLNDLVNLLGQGVLPSIDRLLREGYLACTSPPGSMPAATTGARRTEAPATQSPVASHAPSVPVPATVFPANGASSVAPRRSLAATKMYVIDMLQLQRNAESASLMVSIQISRDPDELIGAVLDALRHIQRSSNASYGRRVAERLAEVIPEEFMPTLQAAQAELPAATT